MSDIIGDIAFYFSQLSWFSLLDILLVGLVIYAVLALVRGTQAETLLRGIILLVLAIALLTTFLRLQAFTWLLRASLPALLLAIPVIFAPEIRRALERLGRAGTNFHWTAQEAELQPVIRALASAAQRLSDRRHGALIVIERQVGLKEYADTGIRLDATITPEAFLQIFYPNTPLHDGAAVVKDDRIVAAACVMPLTSTHAISDRQMGLRHRAALGITEVSDAVALVVSEETGIISVAHNGRMIRRLDAERLTHILMAFYRPRQDRTWLNWLARITDGRRGDTRARPQQKDATGD